MLACPQVFDPEFRKGFPNVQRWYMTLTHFPHFSAVFQVKDLAKERIKGTLLFSFTPMYTSGNLICAQVKTVCIASKCYTVCIASNNTKGQQLHHSMLQGLCRYAVCMQGAYVSSLLCCQDSHQTDVAN